MAGPFEPGGQSSIFGRLRGLFGTRKEDEAAEEEPAGAEPPPVTPVPVPPGEEPPPEEEPAPEEPSGEEPKDDKSKDDKPNDDEEVTAEPPGPTSGEVVVGADDDAIAFEDDLVIGTDDSDAPTLLRSEEERDPAEFLDRIGGVGTDLPAGADEPLGFDKGYLPPEANAVTGDVSPALGGPDTAGFAAANEPNLAEFRNAIPESGAEPDVEAPDLAAAGDAWTPLDTGDVPSYRPGLESAEEDAEVELYDSEPVSDSDQGGADTLDDGGDDLPPDLID